MDSIQVELVYAKDADTILHYEVEVSETATIQDVIMQTGLVAEYPETESYGVGIWAKAAQRSDIVKAGDRVEIYRPLHLSAMEARKKRAL